MERLTEPEVMDNEMQAFAFNDAQRYYSLDPIVYWYEKLSHVKDGTLIDLGCGPAKLLIKLVKKFPNLNVIGVDASESMIKIAERNVIDSMLTNSITFVKSSFLDLENKHYDGVLSTGTLHHLHDPSVLWNTIKRLSKPGTFIFVTDLIRPNSEEEINKLIEILIPNETEFFKTDFFNSFRAAFTEEEIDRQLKEAGLTLNVNVQARSGAKMIFIYGTL